MGMFDKMFGSDAQKASQQPDSQRRFEELKQKYGSVLRMIEQQGIQLSNVHVQDNKLFIKGTAPSADAKNRVWDQVKLIDPSYSDLSLDIKADAQSAASTGEASRTATSSSGYASQSGGQTYTVRPGDTLSKISMQFYGNMNDYMTIFNANRDQLKDPNMIHPGQELVIPPKSA
jgi:LysM repeat protein